MLLNSLETSLHFFGSSRFQLKFDVDSCELYGISLWVTPAHIWGNRHSFTLKQTHNIILWVVCVKGCICICVDITLSLTSNHVLAHHLFLVHILQFFHHYINCSFHTHCCNVVVRSVWVIRRSGEGRLFEGVQNVAALPININSLKV